MSARVNAEFVLPDDLEIALWAESPMFFNPTNIDVDARGRVWVAEAVNYRDFNTAKQGPLTHPAGDRILILTDTDGDGRADASKVFVQDKDLRAPLGLAVIGNRVIVSASPHLIVYTDENGDDAPDRKEILLTGFGGLDHDHGLHALVAGPDGRWYFNTGNAGPHIVTDRSGWTLRAGSLYTGGTPYNQKNQGGMVSDDGRVWTGGLALRIEPDGTRLTVLAHNFRNAYELTVDSFGDLWQNDNDDQVMTCRTSWLMEGANAGYFSADGSRFWQADRRPGQDTFTAHWHQEDPGVLPAGDNTGAGAPAGIVRYESDLLGARYRGLLLSAEAGRNVIFGYLPKAHGAGFALERFDLLSSLASPDENYIWNKVDQDRRKWFRPSDVAAGADGAIYVADWYDPIVGGHQMQDGKGYGRIYRITPKGRTLTTPSIDLSTTAGQIQALLSPAVNVRSSGFERLQAKGVGALTAAKNILADPNPYHRARATWLLARLGPAGVREVERLLLDSDPQIRVTAFRALRQVKASVLDEARYLVQEDSSPAVRREVALSLRDVPFNESNDILTRLARRYDGVDRWSLEALGIGASGHEEALYSMLLPWLGNADSTRWNARFAALAWRLHPKAAIDAFKARAASPLALRLRTTTGGGRAGVRQRSPCRAGHGRPDAHRASRRGQPGSLVDDVPEVERLARLCRGRMGRRSAGGHAGLARRGPGPPRDRARRRGADRPPDRRGARHGPGSGWRAAADSARGGEQDRLSAAGGDRLGHLQQSRPQCPHRRCRLLPAPGRPAAHDRRRRHRPRRRRVARTGAVPGQLLDVSSDGPLDYARGRPLDYARARERRSRRRAGPHRRSTRSSISRAWSKPLSIRTPRWPSASAPSCSSHAATKRTSASCRQMARRFRSATGMAGSALSHARISPRACR